MELMNWPMIGADSIDCHPAWGEGWEAYMERRTLPVVAALFAESEEEEEDVEDSTEEEGDVQPPPDLSGLRAAPNMPHSRSGKRRKKG